MASCSQTEKLKPLVFIKVILQRTIQAKKLMVPRRFTEENEGVFSNFAVLKVPSGDEWRVELLKSDGGEIWLRKGWQHFADFYSLAFGHWLLFEYVGSSRFCVSIYGNDAAEIDYPFKRIYQKSLVPIKEEPLDDSDDILPHPAPNPRRREKPSVMHHLAVKKIRTDGGRMNLERDSLLQSQGIRLKQENNKDSDRNLNLGGCSREVEGGGKEPAPHHECRKGSVRMNSLARAEKAKALDRASSFRSENPFFMVVMQPSYINAGSGLPIPSSVSGKYLTKSTGAVIFKVSGRESCPGVYVHIKVSRGQKTQVRVHRGWKKFVLDNGLNVGDVCVFELIQGKEITFNVSIFSCSKQRDDGQAAAERNGHWRKKVPLEETDERNGLDKINSAFKSQHPFFLAAMYRSYVNPGHRLLIPMEFARKHLKPDGKKSATLQVACTNWPMRITNAFREQLSFSGEWRNFVRGNSLKVGDVCAFELIKREECVLQVTIFRCSGS